jgi:2-keto-4-pentenoate hydratase
MEQHHIIRAAELLVEARTSKRPLAELPVDCKPTSVADANAIIAEVTRRIAEPVGGWKITFVYRPREKPVVAPLFQKNIFSSPALVPPSITHSRLIEPEIAFRLLHDLPPRSRAYHPNEVMEAVIACAALEMNDTRFDTTKRSIRDMLDNRSTILEAHADHQTSGAFVVGEGRSDWKNFDFAAQRLIMRCGDDILFDRVGGHAFSDPFLPVVVLANEMRHSDGLKAGHIVATGSFSGFLQVEKDRPVTAEFVGFGSVTGTFSSTEINQGLDRG